MRIECAVQSGFLLFVWFPVEPVELCHMQSEIYGYVSIKYAFYAVNIKGNLGEGKSPLLDWGPGFMNQPLKTAELTPGQF